MSLRYEELVEEDLNTGTDRVWIVAPSGGELRSTQVGIHTFARGQKKYTKTWVPGLVAASGYVTTTVTVPDAAAGDMVMASFDKMVTNHFTISGHVSAADTVKVEIYNPTATAVTLPSGTLAVVVFPMGAGISEPVATYSVSVRVMVQDAPLSTLGAGYSWNVVLWHYIPDILVYTEPMTPDWEIFSTQHIHGGDPDLTTFANVPAGFYAAYATVASAEEYLVDNTLYNSPAVDVSADTELDPLVFELQGGGG